MALTDDERALVRYHLGYAATKRGVSVGLGAAHIVVQHQAVDLAMGELDPIHEPDIRAILQRMDEIECQKVKVSETLGTAKVEGIELRGSAAIDDLNALYVEQGLRMADLLTVDPCPTSRTWKSLLGFSGGFGGGVREGGW
jgi:hypothetical protein